jgi:predicted glutamine amidotransferase
MGYFGSEAIRVNDLLDAMAELEVAQVKWEKTPVGGHGAGVAFFDGKRELIKVGKENGSPVHALRKQISRKETRLVLAHVRRASEQFVETVGYKECTQPYITNCIEGFDVISAHNGFLRTYKNLKRIIGKVHRYESEKKRFIDSEVIPHYFEDLYAERKGFSEAVRALYLSFCGKGNAVALVLRTQNDLHLALLYKGRARGLYVWENSDQAIFFSSRRETVEKNFASFFKKNDFKIIKAIAPGREGSYYTVRTRRSTTASFDSEQ